MTFVVLLTPHFFLVTARNNTRDEDPGLAKKTGSGALYLKRREIFKSLLRKHFLKAIFFVSILLVSAVP